MLEHRDPLDAEPPREALDALGVVAWGVAIGRGHCAVDVGVDLTGAQHLEPALALAQVAARAVSHEALARAVEARDVDLDARLGEGKVMRAQPHIALLAEHGAREHQQRPLQVGQRDVVVDGEALDLVKLRRVGGVRVRPEHATRNHHVQRRRVRLHHPHLHRRGVRPEHDVLRDIERVRARARGMRGAVVEGVEVVVNRLDLGPLHDREAETEEYVFKLAASGAQHVQPPDRLRRRAGQRDIHPVALELRLELTRAQLPGAPLEQSLERVAGLVGGLADGRPLARLERRHPAQQLWQLGLAPEVAHAQLLERLARVGRRDLVLGLRPQPVDAFGHDVGTLDGRRVISYSATVAAIAALSDSDAIGMQATRSQAETTSPGRPSRSAPTSSVTAGTPPSAGPRSGSRAPASRAMRSPGSSPTSPTRAIGREKMAPMLARTAFGECGSAQPGPSATEDARKACAERSTVPTFPGSPTPCR